MDNSNYIPKKLNLHNRNIQISKPNEDLDINNEITFPTLSIQNISPITTSTNQPINWKNITKDFEDKPIIKELEKQNKDTTTIRPILNTIETNNSIKQDKIKSVYIDETGWTHIVKSTKSKYKEKKKKINPDIDELIKNVISF